MVIFLAVTFFVSFCVHVAVSFGFLTPLYADIVIFVTSGVVLTGLSGHYVKKWQRHKRTEKVLQKNPIETEKTADRPVELEHTKNISMERDDRRRDGEQKLSQTENRYLAELTYQWRTNTVGEMASMVAHELNQPLCAVLNYSDVCLKLLKHKEKEPDKMTDAIEEINIQAKRAAQIIRSLRRLLTLHKPRLSAVHINHDMVEEVIQIIHAEARQNHIRIQTQLAMDLPQIYVDKIQMIQVLLNLVRNGFDAMRGTPVDQRILTITTFLNEQEMVEIRVSDTGEGLSEDMAGRIFDTFFTTKPVGLGIGLPLCRRIVEAHGGKIWAENNPDIGATSRFTLPFNEVMQHGEFQTNSLYCR